MLQTPTELRSELSPRAMRRLEEIVSAINQLSERLERLPLTLPVASQQQVTEAVKGLLGIFGQPILGDPSAIDPLLTQIGTQPGAVSSIAVTNGGDANVNITGSPVTSSGTITVSLSATPSFTTVNVTTQYNVGGTKVVESRKTGWGAASGTLSRTAYASYAGQTMSAAYVQAEAQATDDALKLLGQKVAALITDLTAHGLIGS